MAKLYNSVSELTGKTPLLKLNRYTDNSNRIYAKLECFNPAGSIKDRVAKSMLEDAKERGLISKDTTIIEPTSGNTGIGLSSLAISLGYKVVLTMPESMSVERRMLLKAYGAEIVLTPASEGMSGAIRKAEELSQKTPNSFIPSQFDNPANPQAHYTTTALELWDDTDGDIDIFVAGVGTGGTISGVGKFLKEKNPNIKIIAVEPLTSAVLSGEKSGTHKIQGIGAGFIPKNTNMSIIDEIVKVSNEDAINCANKFAKTEGILVGISSGAALYAADLISNKHKSKSVAVILPDSGERYISMGIYD